MNQSVWTKAAATAQQQSQSEGFDWKKLLAPAVGGLIGAGATSLLSDDDDEDEIIYDELGRPVSKRKGSSGGIGKTLLGGLAGAAAGMGYNAIDGDSMREKWDTVKKFVTGENRKNKALEIASRRPAAPKFPTVDRDGNPLSENNAFARNIMGAHVTGYGALNEEKLRGYTSPDFYSQQLQAAAMNKDKHGGYQYFNKMYEKAKEEFMAKGLDPEDAYNAEAIRQQALLQFDKEHFAPLYRLALEDAYGLQNGTLLPYMPNLTKKYQQELLQLKPQVSDAGMSLHTAGR